VDLDQLEKEYSNLQKEFTQIGYICCGSIMSLYRKCGKPKCGCKDDLEMRHGPYHIWTRKKNGKTVTRSLSKKKAEHCLEYIQNLKKMEKIIEEMKKVSIQIVEEGK
jgi:hypothetical protein